MNGYIINNTSYELSELGMIEKAFLYTVNYKSTDIPTDEENFKGLMAVVDVLQEIHECTDEEKEKAKLQFVK